MPNLWDYPIRYTSADVPAAARTSAPQAAPKLTYQDWLDGFKRFVSPTGEPPMKVTLSKELQDQLDRNTAQLRAGLANLKPTSPTPPTNINNAIRGGIAQGENFGSLSKLLGPAPEIPETSLLGNLKDIIWGSPGVVPGWEATKGVGGAIKDVATALAENAANLAQGLSPVDLNQPAQAVGLPADTFPKFYPYFTDPKGPEASEKGIELLKGLPLLGGLVDPLRQAYTQELAATPYVEGDRYPAAKFEAGVKAFGKVATETFLKDPATLLTGTLTDPVTGLAREATPAEKTKALLFSGLTASVVHGVVRTATGGVPVSTLLEGDMVARDMKRSLSAGELEATQALQDANGAAFKGKLPTLGPKTPPGPDLPQQVVAALEPSLDLFNEALNQSAERTTKGVEQNGNYKYPEVAGARYNQIFDTADAEVQKVFSMQKVVPPEALKGYVSDVILDPLRNKAAQDMVRKGDPVSAAIFKSINDPTLGEIALPKFMEERGVTPEEGRTLVAGSIENTGHAAGQSLNTFSQVLDELEAKYRPAAFNAPLEEMQQAQANLRNIEWWRNQLSMPDLLKNMQASKLLQSGTKLFKGVENIRIPMMLTKLPTTVRVLKQQGLTAASDIFDAFNTSLMATVVHPVESFRNPDLLRQNWSDLLGHAYSIGNLVTNPLQRNAQNILDATPQLGKRVQSGIMGELDNTLGFFQANMQRMGKDVVAGAKAEGLQGAGAAFSKDLDILQQHGHFTGGPETFYRDLPMMAADLFTTGLRAQENVYRKYGFISRLTSNLDVLPAQDLGGELGRVKITARDGPLPTGTIHIIDALKRAAVVDAAGNVLNVNNLPEGVKITDVLNLPTPLRQAIVDAGIHAMRLTDAATPEGWLGQTLQAFKQWNSVSPLQTSMVGPPFVRAMANNIMWQMQHNPANLLEILRPEFREAFNSLGKDGLTTVQARNAQRLMGRGLTGVALLNGAMNMAAGNRSGGYYMGPKPWIWTTGEDAQGNQQTFDVTQYPQLALYSTLGAMIHAKLHNQPNPVGLGDWINLGLNSKIDNAPFLHITDVIRAAGSSNDETAWQAMWKELGQYVAPFGNIPETTREDWGKVVLEPLEMIKNSGQIPAATGDQYRKPATAGQAPVGPLMGKLVPQKLPTKMDPFTGARDEQPSALLDLTVGAPTKMTPLEVLLLHTPGLKPQDITLRYVNPEAQQLVNAKMGQLVNDPQFGIAGQSLQSYARGLNKQNDPLQSKLTIDALLPALRKAAEAAAMQEDMQRSGTQIPPHFREEIVNSLPTGGIDDLHGYYESLLRAQIQSQRNTQPQLPPVVPTLPQR